MTRRKAKRQRCGIAIVSCLLALAPLSGTAQEPADADRFWPQWRGPEATGVAPYGDPPTSWSESSNIRWKVAIPGLGSATPVIWGDRVFVLTAVPVGDEVASTDGLFTRLRQTVTGATGVSRAQQFVIVALDRRDGSVVWERVTHEEVPHEGRHQTGTWASPSAVTDGEVVCAFFGSRGLYCYDLDGRSLWETDLGDMRIRMGFGEGASPVLYKDSLIVPWDHEGDSFIAAFDKHTGRERWRTPRDEMTSWTTPLIVELDGGAQVITSATGAVRAYDAATGVLVWEDEGVTLNAIPSPVSADGLVFVTSGFRGNRLAAIDLASARGDITGTDSVRWSTDRDTPYVPSPVLHDGLLYMLKSNSGILTSLDAATGRPHYGPARLDGIRSVYASPVVADDRLYVTSREGTTVVLRTGPTLEILATNTLDDEFDASPAVVDGELYLRGANALYCIAED
ncbi:MAG: PQQ-like beta-propeller repeat protein [Acidobacteria bacterium]|nr:PQQ-like beta-propeller repeat protein [Acidobacteriota bacterium]